MSLSLALVLVVVVLMHFSKKIIFDHILLLCFFRKNFWTKTDDRCVGECVFILCCLLQLYFCIFFLLKTNYSQIITSVFVYFYRFLFVNKTSCLCFVSFFLGSLFLVFSLERRAFLFLSSLVVKKCFSVLFFASVYVSMRFLLPSLFHRATTTTRKTSRVRTVSQFFFCFSSGTLIEFI